MHILVCGGAGYIGAHMLKALDRAGHRVTTFDNLSTGHESAVRWGQLVVGDLLDQSALAALFGGNDFDAVMHFSAKSLVGESGQDPALYYRNNVTGSLNLLDAMRHHGVDRFVFSSTAAVYGSPETDRIDETHPRRPINPYGRSKLMVENMLADLADAYGLKAVALRYFNAAGADRDGEIGEDHAMETHLIPNILKSALGAGGGSLKLFGTDYPTPDGTCVRDYIHVEDLAAAHLAALDFLDETTGFHAFNLGNGQGFSVLEVINAAREITGTDIPYDVADRRDGDPAILVADSARASRALGWQPIIPSITAIISSAWNWHQKRHG